MVSSNSSHVWISSCGKFKSEKYFTHSFSHFIHKVFAYELFEILFHHFLKCANKSHTQISTQRFCTSTGKSKTTNINNQIKFLFSHFRIYVFVHSFLLFLLLLLMFRLIINIVHFFYSFFMYRSFHWRRTNFSVNKTHSVGYHGFHDW